MRSKSKRMLCDIFAPSDPSQYHLAFDDRGSRRAPGAELADEGVEGWREQQAEDRNPEHSEEHGRAERLAHLRACPRRHGERENTENEGERGHQYRAQADPGGRCGGFFGPVIRIAFFAARPTSTTKPIWARMSIGMPLNQSAA